MVPDWELRVGFAGFDLKSRKATIWDSGNGYWSATNLASVGQAVVGVLLHPEETKNRYVWIESFRTSQNETLAALEKATGEKWTVKHVKCAEQIEEGREAYRKGDPNWFMQLIIGALFNEELDVGADFSKFAKLDNELLGVPTEDIQATVDAVVQERPQFDWVLSDTRRVILTTAA